VAKASDERKLEANKFLREGKNNGKKNLKKEDTRKTPKRTTEEHLMGMPAFLYKETHNHYRGAGVPASL